MKFEDPFADEDQGLNLTPMIDVVFLLLIFFMLATTFMDPERDINLDLPKASDIGTSAEQSEELVINVMRDGSVVVGGAQLDDNGLLATLRQAALKDAERQVTIRGDRMTMHENIVKCMNLCGTAGLSNLAISTIDGGI
ncbi:MAG: biopolymer transporter ExbD [Planctomycetes bacterium]|nr:biopolymer transporter ExbD [Planctomycetota bacterium]